MKNQIKSFLATIFITTAFMVQAQTADQPEIFQNIPTIHEDFLQRPLILSITPEEVQGLVDKHDLIGKKLVQDCFDSQPGHVCLDEIVSYVGKDKEDYIEFRVVKNKQIVRAEEYINRITIYLNSEEKIAKVVRQ